MEGMAWSPPSPVDGLNNLPGTYHLPGGNADDPLRMILSSGGPEFDLYEATRSLESEPWTTPTPVVSLNTSTSELDAHLTSQGTVVYFASYASGEGDLCTASRDTTDAPFGPPTCLDELNDPARDDHPWVSRDGRHIVFSSTGVGRLYEASR